MFLWGCRFEQSFFYADKPNAGQNKARQMIR